MPTEPTPEFIWFQRWERHLSERYLFEWIAIDGRRVAQEPSDVDSIIVSHSEDLGEAVERAGVDRDLFLYAFVDRWVGPPQRQAESE